MGDFIAKYGIFAGVGVFLLGAAISRGVPLVVRYVRQRRRGVPTLPLAIQPRDVEVIPLWFEVSLNQQIPDVRVWVQVVNCLRVELRLGEVTATYCHINQGPPLENIPAGEYRIPPRQSWQVMCRRTLLDAETKVLLALPWSEQFTAALNVRVRGAAGKQTISLDPGGFNIRGWITGLPSHPSIKRAPTT